MTLGLLFAALCSLHLETQLLELLLEKSIGLYQLGVLDLQRLLVVNHRQLQDGGLLRLLCDPILQILNLGLVPLSQTFEHTGRLLLLLVQL